MAVRYLNNKRHSVDVLVTSNAEIVIAGNSSVSNIALSGQDLIGASIKQVFCGSPSGNAAYWEVSRGNTSVSNVIVSVDSTAYLDFAGNGIGLEEDASANLVLKLFRAADDEGSILLTLHKQTQIPDDSTY